MSSYFYLSVRMLGSTLASMKVDFTLLEGGRRHPLIMLEGFRRGIGKLFPSTRSAVGVLAPSLPELEGGLIWGQSMKSQGTDPHRPWVNPLFIFLKFF